MSVHAIDPRTGLKWTGTGPKAYKVRGPKRNGKQLGATFDRKADADAYDLELKRRARARGTRPASDTLTLDWWRKNRWARDHARDLEQSTRDLYDRHWRQWIGPYLGHLPLADITIDELADWQADLVDELELSPDAVHKARTALGSVLTHAATARAGVNNLRFVKAPKADHRDEVIPLSPLEIERIRSVLDDVRDRIIVSLLAYAGLRPGELRALLWADRRQRTLLVQRAADPGGQVKATKTGQSRTVKILPFLGEDLDAWSLRALAGSRRPIITPDIWTQSQWSAWRRNVWRPACEKAGLDPIPRPYDLRHSFASLLLAEGQGVLDVAKQLGHSARMTLDVYGHVIDEYDGLAAQERPIADTAIREARERFPATSQPAPEQEAA